MRLQDLFNRKKNPYAQADGTNPEGFPSFERSLEEAYLQVLLTNTLGGTYYANQRELFDEAVLLHLEIAEKDPAFMARAILYARSEGLMRFQPIVGLAVLAKTDHDLFRAIFSDVIRTPGDLADFVEVVRGGVLPGGMGRMIKTAVNHWLNSMSEYHAIKYNRGGQGYSLRDILRVSHPKPVNFKQDAIFKWLVDSKAWLADEDARERTPQIDAFERLKRVEGNQEVARALITEGRLPYEVVTGVFRPDRETWVSLMQQMPYFALLRHLNTLQRADVLSEEANATYVAERLSNADALRKAKVLPFRVYTAYQQFTPARPTERRVQEALIDALEASMANMPNLGERVVVAPDVSGSMSGRISGRSVTRYIDIAGIFTAALLKSTPDAIILPFENDVVDVKLSARDSAITTAEKLARVGGGGTAVSAPISRLLAKRIPVDTFIGITDNVEWARDSYGNQGFLPTWYAYKEQVAPEAKAFLLTIAPYRHAVAPESAPDVFYTYGWNDSVLRFITMQIEGLAGQVETVRAMSL